MILVAYYSRTGNTKKVALEITKELNCKIEEIFDTKNRSGAKGWLLAGRDATKKTLTKLKPITHNPADYDIIIIGTPIWSWNVSSPIRTYLTENRGKFNQVAFFCTMGSSGDNRAFQEMSGICGKQPIACVSLTAKEIIQNNFTKLENFIKILLQS